MVRRCRLAQPAGNPFRRPPDRPAAEVANPFRRRPVAVNPRRPVPVAAAVRLADRRIAPLLVAAAPAVLLVAVAPLVVPAASQVAVALPVVVVPPVVVQEIEANVGRSVVVVTPKT